jgi:acyl-CoA reductase-like NAD-dependent aldehyde dehydrogenase
MSNRYRLLIGGDWTDAVSRKTFATYNPATGDHLAEVAEADAADVDKAVQCARAAFEDGPWRRMDAAERGRILCRVADGIRARADALARLETLDNGKAIRETRAQVNAAADYFEYYGGWADKVAGHVIPVRGRFHTYTVREPVGVCGQIIPWNSPLPQAAQKLAPALAAGCTTVLKPAEQTPVTALELGKILLEAGLPEGVVNILSGYGPTAGAALAAHPGVDKVAFTGEVSTGQSILRAAIDDLKRVTLELGGKAPNIVCEDADLDRAVRGTLFGIFAGAGQYCDAGPRLFVHRKVRDVFMQKLLDLTRKIRLGDPLDPATHVGSLTSKEQLDKVAGYVDLGRQEGAEVVAGGRRPSDPALAAGQFYLPTIFDGVRPRMRIAQEEIFGPVLAVLDFEDDDRLVADANDTVYGLAAGIWTGDARRAFSLAARLKAGTVWINTLRQTQIAAPFGGYKMSGIGREKGLTGLEAYTEMKTVWVDLNEAGIGYFDS